MAGPWPACSLFGPQQLEDPAVTSIITAARAVRVVVDHDVGSFRHGHSVTERPSLAATAGHGAKHRDSSARGGRDSLVPGGRRLTHCRGNRKRPGRRRCQAGCDCTCLGAKGEPSSSWRQGRTRGPLLETLSPRLARDSNWRRGLDGKDACTTRQSCIM